MRIALADPNSFLRDVESHVTVGFRRLYRQRNLVIHWGKTDAVALNATLRTAAPLVGAGMTVSPTDGLLRGLLQSNLRQGLDLALIWSGITGSRSPIDLLA